MRLSIDLGGLKVNVSTSGGLRIGKKLGGTYISTQVIKPKKRGRNVSI